MTHVSVVDANGLPISHEDIARNNLRARIAELEEEIKRLDIELIEITCLYNTFTQMRTETVRNLKAYQGELDELDKCNQLEFLFTT